MKQAGEQKDIWKHLYKFNEELKLLKERIIKLEKGHEEACVGCKGTQGKQEIKKCNSCSDFVGLKGKVLNGKDYCHSCFLAGNIPKEDLKIKEEEKEEQNETNNKG